MKAPLPLKEPQLKELLLLRPQKELQRPKEHLPLKEQPLWKEQRPRKELLLKELPRKQPLLLANRPQRHQVNATRSSWLPSNHGTTGTA